MGLFSDLFGSSSHTQTTQSTSNVTNTQLSGGPLSGNVNYGGGTIVTNNVNNTVDAGTVQAATDISSAALQLGANEVASNSAVAIAGMNHAQDAYTSSLAFAGDVTQNSIASVSDATGKALDGVTRFASSALDSNTFIAGKSLDALSQ